MEDAIKMQVAGLKCDNPNCDYIDMSIRLEDYEKYLNAKCPKCGSILLTESDFNNVQAMIEIAKVTNGLFAGVDLANKGEDKIVRVHMNGTGTMKFEVIK